MLPTCFHHVSLFPSSASFLLATILILQFSISTASSVLVKRPASNLPAAIPIGVSSSFSGAPLTEPVCDPVFGFPKASECICAMEAMERDAVETMRTAYHGPNFQIVSTLVNFVNFDGTVTRIDVPSEYYVETPKIYSCGTCLITIYPLGDREFDMAHKSKVKTTAGGIIMRCTLTIDGAGGVNIAGENRKLWISVLDVPSLDRKLRYKTAHTNDPAIVKHMKDYCRWPPTGPTTASQDNFQAFTCGDSSQQAVGSGAGGGGGGGGATVGADEETEEALRAELIETMGERACTLEGVGDGRGACGDGWVCRAQSWVDKAEEILFGLGSMMGTGICGLAS